MCLFCTLMFQSATPSLLSSFILHWIIAFILHICCVTVTPVHVCGCVCVCVYVRMCVCVWVDVLVLHSWCFRVSPRHRWVFFLHCGRFVDCFFYDHLDCSNQALNFFCVCSHSKCHKVTKFHTIPMKLWFKTIVSVKSDRRAPEG